MLFQELHMLAFSRRISRTFPETPEEAAQALFDALTPDSREALARVKYEDLPNYDQPLGDYCRNSFGRRKHSASTR